MKCPTDLWLLCSTTTPVATSIVKAVIFVTAYQTEGFDGVNLKLNDIVDDLIKLVASQNMDFTVVIHPGQQVDMEAWVEHSTSPASSSPTTRARRAAMPSPLPFSATSHPPVSFLSPTPSS